jgi:hypothetical protein
VPVISLTATSAPPVPNRAATSKGVELVMTPLRMAIWRRDHDGRPVVGEELIHHSDAG